MTVCTEVTDFTFLMPGFSTLNDGVSLKASYFIINPKEEKFVLLNVRGFKIE